MLTLFASIFGLSWLRFCYDQRTRTIATPDAPDLTTEEQALVDAILARCALEQQATVPHDPITVERWVDYAWDYNQVVVVARPNCAVAIAAPKRIH